MAIKTRNKLNPNFSVSSMTDIIFLLLVFFMVSSTVIQSRGLDVSLPKSSVSDEEQTKLAISISKERNFFLEEEAVSLAELEGKILAQRNLQKNLSITLYADKTVPVADVVRIMEIAKKHQIKLLLATDSQ